MILYPKKKKKMTGEILTKDNSLTYKEKGNIK